MPPITYRRLDEVLRSLGFSVERSKNECPPTRIYTHDALGPLILLPVLPEDMEVQAGHLAGVRLNLEWFGIAAPREFDACLHKAS